MQRQKTVAKWLAVVLLITLSVGCYVVYDAFVAGSRGGASAGDGAPPAGSPEEDEVLVPPPSEFPRSADSYLGLTVSHIGGEGDDIARAAVFAGDKTAVFFSSDSRGHDAAGEGMYLALMTDSELLSVTRIEGGAGETPVAAANTGRGVLLLTKSEEGCAARLFGTDFRLLSRAGIPSFDDALIRTYDGVTRVFYIDSRGINSGTLSASATLLPDQNFLPGSYAKLHECYAADGVYSLIAASDAQGLTVAGFTQNGGFKVRYSAKNRSFVQFVPLATDEGAGFAMLSSDGSGLRLGAFSPGGEETASADIDGAANGYLFSDGNTLRVLAGGRLYTYCRHLDTVTQRESARIDGELLFSLRVERGELFGVAEGGSVAVYSFADDSDLPLLLLSAEGTPEGKCFAASDPDSLRLVLSTRSDKDMFAANFGGADAFFVTLSTEESGVRGGG